MLTHGLMVSCILLSFFIITSNHLVLSLFALLFLYFVFSLILFFVGLPYVGSIILLMYVSAVGILFLFVVILVEDKSSSWQSIDWFALTTLLLVLLILLTSSSEGSLLEENSITLLDDLTELHSLGQLLFTSLLWEVLVVGLLCILIVFSIFIN